jgi:hypothetical protein
VHYAVKAYSSASALGGGEWSVSCPCRFAAGTLRAGGWLDPRVGWTTCRSEKLLAYRNSNSDPSVGQLVASRYTDCPSVALGLHAEQSDYPRTFAHLKHLPSWQRRPVCLVTSSAQFSLSLCTVQPPCAQVGIGTTQRLYTPRELWDPLLFCRYLSRIFGGPWCLLCLSKLKDKSIISPLVLHGCESLCRTYRNWRHLKTGGFEAQTSTEDDM